MSVKTVIQKLTTDKKTLLKRSLIVTGTVAGIALAAGLVVRNKKALGNVIDATVDSVDKLTTK
jgi:predicted hydrolase (HD superfamily)